MVEYKILIKPSAVKELERIPKKVAGLIIKKIRALSQNPRPIGCQKLSGQERYRIRQGDYRVVYGIDDKNALIEIVKIAHRKEVYL